MFARSWFVTLSLLLCLGCDRQTNTTPPAETDLAASANVVAAVKPVSADPESAVAAIEAVTTKVRRDSSGSIIDVDFRGLDVTDGDLVPLVELPRLRAVRLGGTAVTDAAMTTIGQIVGLEDLDLRDCGITDDGLAELSGLKRLKALRLSGKSGACSVSDDGMVHVAKLNNLKVLAIDYLWISEDGIKVLVGLKTCRNCTWPKRPLEMRLLSYLLRFRTLGNCVWLGIKLTPVALQTCLR